MIIYGYDEAGRLARKIFPNGMETSYAYDIAGRLSELTHRDREGILDRYSYQYDLVGNKTAIEKQRKGLDEESGIYTYGYDALWRLNTVARNGKTLRNYEYDAFGNRSLLKEGDRKTVYFYNAMNQLINKVDALNEESYAYDKRGNLNLIMENGVLKNRYTYGTLNRLEQAVNRKGETASYSYNGLGYRVGKDIGPETKIQYTIDLTKSYNNLLQKEEEKNTQIYLWDGNVTGMSEDGKECEKFYLQDELGSPIRLMGYQGELEESYGYDEFGQDIYGNQGIVQPFCYTGYQADQIAGTYFAQAREYKPELGRFGAVDVVKGFIIVPYTLNAYGYCWGNPMVLVDLDGWFPSLNDIKNEGSKFYNENKKVIDTTGKILFTLLAVASAVMIGVMGAVAMAGVLAPTAAIVVGASILLGGAVGGVTGGLSNRMTGGSFLNGFCGGSINGSISMAAKFAGQAPLGNLFGGFAGNLITELFNNMDIEDPQEKKSDEKILITSATVGLTQMVASVGSIGKLVEEAGLPNISASNYIAMFFEQNLGFMSGSISYIFADGILGTAGNKEKEEGKE